MEIVLTIADRIILGSLLPTHGGKIKMILIKTIADQVEFTPKEITEFELNDKGGGLVTWNVTKGREFRMTFTPEQVQVLKESIQEADKREQVTVQMLPLIEKIEAL